MENMKKIVMLFLATMILGGAPLGSHRHLPPPSRLNNGMASDTKSDSAAPKKTKKAKKAKSLPKVKEVPRKTRQLQPTPRQRPSKVKLFFRLKRKEAGRESVRLFNWPVK